MDEEYVRMLCLKDIENLYECGKGYMDLEDCSWYHRNWMLLRYLGMVSNPLWHENFYQNVISKYLQPDDKVLVMGTADFSMPYVCQKAGLRNITISDICQTPLNICRNVSEYNGFSWNISKQDIFDGFALKYHGIINDAFLTRFSYKEKRKVFECIRDGLLENGVYITTVRRGWNNWNPIIPTDAEKREFIARTERSAAEKGISNETAKESATQYIDRMISYPVRDEAMIRELIGGLFDIEYIGINSVVGECVPSEYFQIVLRKSK